MRVLKIARFKGVVFTSRGRAATALSEGAYTYNLAGRAHLRKERIDRARSVRVRCWPAVPKQASSRVEEMTITVERPNWIEPTTGRCDGAVCLEVCMDACMAVCMAV